MRLFSGAVGINNKVPPHRLIFDAESGVSALEGANNMLIDKTGEPVTRRGTTAVSFGDYHSSFPAVGGFYVVEERTTDSALLKAVVQASGELAFYGIRSGMAKGRRMSYAEINGDVLYCNGADNGMIRSGASLPWPTQRWTGPDDSVSDMVDMPVGEHIGILAGRTLIAVGSELFFSEHGLFNLMNGAKNNVRFESKIVMVAPVSGGVFVSDKDNIFFLSGNNPNKWGVRKVSADYPAVEYGCHHTLVDPSLFGFDTSTPASLFATVRGQVLGFQDGTIINLINKNVAMPHNCGLQTGSIMVVDETTIIQSGT